MDLADFDYHLPAERIAQEPLADRAAARMLVVDRAPTKTACASRVQRIRVRYGLASGMIEYQPELWSGEEQGELFPLQ